MRRLGRTGAAVAASAAAAVVLALVPAATAQAVGDSVTLSGITAGQYLALGSTTTITASATTTSLPGSVNLVVDGTTVLDTQPCVAPPPDAPAPAPDCVSSLSLDTTTLSVAAHSVLVEYVPDVPGSVASATSSTVSFRVGDEPTATIDSPADGSTLVGTVDVQVTGTTDPTGTDYPKSFELVVDGTPLAGATANCEGTSTTCTRTITGVSVAALAAGPVSVRLTTNEFVTRTSPTITVNPAEAPTVSISSPADGATHVLPDASDTVGFSVSGAGDAGLGAVAKTFDLFLDGGPTPVDSFTCAAATGSCSTTLTWDASGVVTAAHTATVRITVKGVTATATSSFTLAAEPDVTVQDPGGSLSGATSVTVTAQTDAATSERPQSVVLTAVNASDPAIVLPSRTCDAPVVGGACTFTIPWDVSALSGSYNLTAVLTTSTGRTRTSPVTGVAIANAGPVITVTAPTATVVKGRVTVSASARVGDKITGRITTMKLFAGGAQVGATKTCAADVAVCTYSATWDTTTLANASNVQIAAQVTTSTTGAKTFNSTARVVTLRNPKPAAVFTSPRQGSVASGSAVRITVGLSTDASQSDVPKGAALYRNGSSTPIDTYACTKGTRTCTATFTWDARRAFGRSSFTVKVRTTKNRVGTSSARILYASSGARIVFDPTTTVDNGTRVKVSGKLVAVRTGQPLAGRKVSILRDPAVGSSVRGTLVTSSTGRFSFTFAATSNTKITATSTAVRTPLGAIYVPPGTGSSSQKVRAPLRCVVRDVVIASGGKGKGSCSAPGLPVGTPLILRYRYNGVWRTLASGQSSSASFPFVYQFPKSGFYQLRVILSGNRAYAGTNSALMSVTVR